MSTTATTLTTQIVRQIRMIESVVRNVRGDDASKYESISSISEQTRNREFHVATGHLQSRNVG